MFDSPAKRKPEEDPEKAKSDDSVHEEEKEQVGVIVSRFLTPPFFGTFADDCDFMFGLSKWT